MILRERACLKHRSKLIEVRAMPTIVLVFDFHALNVEEAVMLSFNDV